MSEIIIQQALPENRKGSTTINKVNAKSSPSTNKSIPPNMLLIAFFCIYRSVLINNQTAQGEAKQLQNNATAQNKLLKQEQGFSFIGCNSKKELLAFINAHPTICKNVIGTYIGSVTSKGGLQIVWFSKVLSLKPSKEADVVQDLEGCDQITTAIRQAFQSKVNIRQQDGQLIAAKLSNTANIGENEVQQGGAIMTMLAQIANQIMR